MKIDHTEVLAESVRWLVSESLTGDELIGAYRLIEHMRAWFDEQQKPEATPLINWTGWPRKKAVACKSCHCSQDLPPGAQECWCACHPANQPAPHLT